MDVLQARYKTALSAGTLQPDVQQAQAVKVLDRLLYRLTARSGFLARILPAKPVKGLYLYGSVGRGKTMLMDWCFQALRDKGVKTERWHFHAFMLEIHQNLKDQGAHSRTLENRIEALADVWAERVAVLCFDEFHVTDVADAMIMMALFTRMFERGVTVISTSNWAPENLYSGGLQRQRFLPFIDVLKARMEIVCIDGATDYRALKLQTSPAWLAPLDDETAAAFEHIFLQAVGYDPIETHELHVSHNRTWSLNAASRNVARLNMRAVLGEALGAADFMALSRRYKLLFLDELDRFTADGNERAKRFMVMIDVLYDKDVKLVVRAQDAAEKLYPAAGALAFEFSRTASRLKEMTPPRQRQ